MYNRSKHTEYFNIESKVMKVYIQVHASSPVEDIFKEIKLEFNGIVYIQLLLENICLKYLCMQPMWNLITANLIVVERRTSKYVALNSIEYMQTFHE